MSTSKRKGTAWESVIVGYLRENGAPHAERRTLAGAKDRGDIAGLPGVVVEAKSAARIELASWMDETEAERANDNAQVAACWVKRRGRTSPGAGYVVMTGEQFVALLTEAGYIAAAGKPEPVVEPTPLPQPTWDAPTSVLPVVRPAA